MWHIAALDMPVSCTTMVEPIEMLFGGLTRMGTRNHVLDESPDPPREAHF